MADELLKRIEAPQLNTAGYGNNISEQFNLIDLNFQSLANSDFFTGAQGKGLRLIKVETKSSPDLSPVFIFSENLKAHEDSILNNTGGEKLKKSIKDAFTNYIPSNTTWYADKEYTLYIEEPNNTVHNVYPIICMTEYEDVNGNKNQSNEYLDFSYEGSKLVLKPSSGFPSLYFDTTLGKFCWLINGKKSGIVAQGSDGKNGERGPGLDFDVIEAETIPSDKDSFYKIKRVFWKNRMQKFYLNLSTTDAVLGTNGETVNYDEYDVEWLYGGREEWINNNKNRTFLVSRHIEEIKGEDGSITKPAENVLHLCKLIKKTARRIASSIDDVGDVEEPLGIGDDIVVDEESVSPALISESVSPETVNQFHASTIVKPPVFQVDFDTAAKDQFKQEYKETSNSVSNIIAGEVDAIQYVNASTGKIEIAELSSTDKAQLATQVANYAEDIYGVYLTDENMHILNSTISAGSSTGISIAFDDIRWDQSNSSALRCMYLKDEMGDDGGKDPGILLYNRKETPDASMPELYLRYVNNVGSFSKGSPANGRLDPDTKGHTGANINIGTGRLKAGSIDLSEGISIPSDNDNAEIKFNADDKQLNISNSGGVTVNGSKFTNDGAIATGTIITTGNIGSKGDLTVNGQLKVGDNIVIKSNNNLHIDYEYVIKLVSLGTPSAAANGFEKTLDKYGVTHCIDIPQVIYNFMEAKEVIKNMGDIGEPQQTPHTYIGGNYNLRIRRVGRISEGNFNYKITGYVDFCGDATSDDIGHMIIDTYFNYDGNTVSIPYRANRNDNDSSKWALPFAGVVIDPKYSVSKQAICLSTMSGPYMSFESVIVEDNDENNSSTLRERKLELPFEYRPIPRQTDPLMGIHSFEAVASLHYKKDDNPEYGEWGYKLYHESTDNPGAPGWAADFEGKFTTTFASPNQNTSNIPVYNKSVWITKTSYTPKQ